MQDCVSRQRHHFIFLQAADHLKARRIRDSYMNFASCQPRFPHAQRILGDHKHIAVPALGIYRRARHRQHVVAFVRMDAHVHINIRQQFQFLVIHRAQ